MNIIGIGVDIIEINKITEIGIQSAARKILSSEEYSFFLKITHIKNQLNFIAGRWATKEAIFKTSYTNHKTKDFHHYTILNNNNGVPYLKYIDPNKKLMISISHSGQYAVSFVILTQE